MKLSSPLRVLFLASEADPFVKVGGLGDVAGSLPPAIRRLTLTEDDPFPAVDIRLAIPFHGLINPNAYSLKQVAAFEVPHADGPVHAEVFETELNGVPVYLIGGDAIPNTMPVYSNDLGLDGYKYVFFSLAALELARRLKWQPHIVHANDWHTAAAVYYIYRNRKSDPFFRKTATILGIHNLPYLGVGADPSLGAFGLPPAIDSGLPDWAINLPLPLGLLSADRIVAVSPTYAREIMTPEFGSGLHDFLLTRKSKITGILNGLDMPRWDPADDPQLKTTFTSQTLDRRAQNKAAMREELFLTPEHTGLPEETPLLVMISRMDYQKGVDLTLGALNQILDLSWQAVILGTGQFDIEAMVRSMDQNHPQRVRAAIRFDPNLSRRLYASADMLLIPSRYEPCGLTQMIAMRYGCIPVARATGGLKDTIEDGETGFLFDDATPEALAGSLRRAIEAYQQSKTWRAIQRRGMKQDFSWERSAKAYIQLYTQLLNPS